MQPLRSRARTTSSSASGTTATAPGVRAYSSSASPVDLRSRTSLPASTSASPSYASPAVVDEDVPISRRPTACGSLDDEVEAEDLDPLQLQASRA